MTIFGQRQTPKKRRKSRTAFTNHQIYELEKRFLYQKYTCPPPIATKLRSSWASPMLRSSPGSRIGVPSSNGTWRR